MRKSRKEDKMKEKRRAGGRTGFRLRILVVCVFTAIYFLGMLLATWVDQNGRTREYAERVQHMLAFVSKELEEGSDGSTLSNLSRFADYYSSEEQLVSFAVYDKEGLRECTSQNVFSYSYKDGEGWKTTEWILNDYLTQKEMEQLVRYVSCHTDEGRPQYYIKVQKAENGENLNAVNVKYLAYSTDALKNEGDPEIKWSWVNPDVENKKNGSSAEVQDEKCGPDGNSDMYFPGISCGEAVWREWNASDYLRNFPDSIEDYMEPYSKETEKEGFMNYRTDMTPVSLTGTQEYTQTGSVLAVRAVERPWHAAVNSLKNIYLWGAVLTTVCVSLVLYIMEMTFRKRAQLEEQQKDFSNAIAHEMKTPLSVIRGFAENLEEDTNRNKKKYYVEQIIDQTERLDEMVKEMVFISRQNSQDYCAAKEEISVCGLIRELRAVYDDRIDDRRIEMDISCGEDFVINGDRKAVRKAFAELLKNAVDHNRDEGKIRIKIEKKLFVIENTGEKIPQEVIARVCELFYTGDRNRSGEERHLGLGLYLADRIFRSHGLKLRIANTEEGVRVAVEA